MILKGEEGLGIPNMLDAHPEGTISYLEFLILKGLPLDSLIVLNGVVKMVTFC